MSSRCIAKFMYRFCYSENKALQSLTDITSSSFISDRRFIYPSISRPQRVIVHLRWHYGNVRHRYFCGLIRLRHNWYCRTSSHRQLRFTQDLTPQCFRCSRAGHLTSIVSRFLEMSTAWCVCRLHHPSYEHCTTVVCLLSR